MIKGEPVDYAEQKRSERLPERTENLIDRTPRGKIKNDGTRISTQVSQGRASLLKKDGSERQGGILRSLNAAKAVEDASSPVRKSNYFTHGRGLVATDAEKQLRAKLGIDCTDLIHFSQWEPGGEYVKYITVKNVATKTQKIRYQLTKTRFFSMDFPKLTTLSAGMKYSVPVTFRPVAKEAYDDVVEFQTSEGKFQLRVCATLPKHELAFEPVLDFKNCPVREAVSKKLSVKNVGELETAVEWTVKDPFKISPQHLLLKPGEESVCEIKFHPLSATGYEENALCTFGSPSTLAIASAAVASSPASSPLPSNVSQQVNVRSLVLKGAGKFSFLKVEREGLLDFGKVFNTGQSANSAYSLPLVLHNPSLVEAKFQIQPSEPKHASKTFEFSRHSGVVPAQQSLKLEVVCLAPSANVTVVDYYTIKTVSGNTVALTCRAVGVGPSVSLSCSVLNFGDVNTGTTLSRAMSISNDSDFPTYYQFDLPSDATFNVSKPSGVIGKHSKIDFTVKFSPTECMNYWRPVFCLVENHKVLAVDFIGTGFDDRHRPATFQTKFLTRYKARLLSPNRLWQYHTEQLESMLKNQAVNTLEPAVAPADTVEAFFNENAADNCPASLLESFIDFGSCPIRTLLDNMVLRVANHTKGKMGCVWIVPENSAFGITPLMADIPADSVGEFCVQFKPQLDQTYYGQQIECYAYFKSMRNFRLVSEQSFTPPWCLTATLAGNTFSKKNPDVLIPSISADGLSAVDFSACLLNSSLYRIVRFTNECDTPLQYDFALRNEQENLPVHRLPKLDSVPFSVKPRCGFLKRGESQCIVFKFSPEKEQTYEKFLNFVLNKSASQSVLVHLKGIGSLPKICALPESPHLLRPISLGTSANVELKLRNKTRLLTRYSWNWPKSAGNGAVPIVEVLSESGTAEPNGEVCVKLSVRPSVAKKQVVRLNCLPYCGETLGTPVEVVMLVQGIVARLESSTQELNFGHILVNSRSEQVFTVINSTDSDIFYLLETSLTVSNGDGKLQRVTAASESGAVPGLVLVASQDAGLRTNAHQVYPVADSRTGASDELLVIQPSAILPARSRHVVKVIAYLQQQKKYDLRISYRDSSNMGPSGKAIQVCHATVTGVLPAVQAVDIFAEGLSKRMLWSNFHLKKLNSVLNQLHARPRPRTPITCQSSGAADVSDPQVAAKALRKRVSIAPHLRPEPIEFNFGVGRLHSEATQVLVCLHNDGVVPVTCHFCFPHDLDVRVEQWVGSQPPDVPRAQSYGAGSASSSAAGSTGNASNFGDSSQSAFFVSPKRQIIPPKESAVIQLGYLHTVPGRNKLPVICRLKDESDSDCHDIELVFCGTTLTGNEPFMDFQSSVVETVPVSVGCRYPPIQSVSIHNPSNMSIEWEADFSGCNSAESPDLITASKSSGYLLPNATDRLEYIFRPVEVRQYDLHVPIKVSTVCRHNADSPNSSSTSSVAKSGRSRKAHSSVGHYVGSACGPSLTSYTLNISAVGQKSVQRLLESHFIEKQWIKVPSLGVSVSSWSVDFDQVKLGSVCRRAVSIKNESDTDSVSFKWHANCGREVDFEVQPNQGKLDPNELLMCKMVLRGGYVPRSLNFSVRLEIMTDGSEPSGHVAKSQAATFITPTVRRTGTAEKERNKVGGSKFSVLPSIGKAGNCARSEPENVKDVNCHSRTVCIDVSARVLCSEDGVEDDTSFVTRHRLPSSLSKAPRAQLSFLDATIVADVLTEMLDCLGQGAPLLKSCQQSSNLSLFSTFDSVSARELAKLAESPAEVGTNLDANLNWYTLSQKCAAFRQTDDRTLANTLLGVVDSAVYDAIPFSGRKAIVGANTGDYYGSAEQLKLAHRLVDGQSIEFPNLLEAILENVIFNIVQEAARDEFEITALPKYVKLS